MLAVVAWLCECGTHLKVMYETGPVTILHCPNVPCKATHAVTGAILSVYVEEANHVWEQRDWTGLVAPPESGA